MSTSVSNNKSTRVHKVCTLWTHDDNFSRDDIIFNAEKFPEIPTALGTLLQIVALDSGTSVRDFQSTANGSQANAPQAKDGTVPRDSGANTLPKRSRRGSMTVTIDENGSSFPGGRDIDAEKAYVFAVAALPADLRSKHANLQVGHLRQPQVRTLTCSKGVDFGENCESIRFPQPDAGDRCRGTMSSCKQEVEADTHRPTRRSMKHIMLSLSSAMSISHVQTCGVWRSLSLVKERCTRTKSCFLWVRSKLRLSISTLTAIRYTLDTSRLEPSLSSAASLRDMFCSFKCPKKCGTLMPKVLARSCSTKLSADFSPIYSRDG
jgi:hypothetical protein